MKRRKSAIFAVLILCVPALAMSETTLPLPIRNVLDYRKVPHDVLSVYVEELTSGDVVLALNEDTPRNPASVEKMVTTLVALDSLGPTYRWKTEVSALGNIVDGSLDGDLLLKGYGDPYLVTERFWQMLRRIRQSGIENIAGNLLLDDSYFETAASAPTFFKIIKDIFKNEGE